MTALTAYESTEVASLLAMVLMNSDQWEGSADLRALQRAHSKLTSPSHARMTAAEYEALDSGVDLAETYWEDIDDAYHRRKKAAARRATGKIRQARQEGRL